MSGSKIIPAIFPACSESARSTALSQRSLIWELLLGVSVVRRELYVSGRGHADTFEKEEIKGGMETINAADAHSTYRVSVVCIIEMNKLFPVRFFLVLPVLIRYLQGDFDSS